GWPCAVLRIVAILCYATPVFFAGVLLKLVFSGWLGWLPLSGRATPQVQLVLGRISGSSGINIIDALRTGRWDLISDVLAHAALPAIALGLLTAGVFLRLVRTNVIGTLGREYVDAARSRGVKESRLVRKHRSEEHTSELQSRFDFVCRLLLDKKKFVYILKIFLVILYI